jgi:hypothetical protein
MHLFQNQLNNKFKLILLFIVFNNLQIKILFYWLKIKQIYILIYHQKNIKIY